MRAPFRVIEGDGLQRPHAARAHAVRSSEPLILPPIKIPLGAAYSLIGMTSRQANMVFHGAPGTAAQLSMLKAFSRVHDVQRELAEALTVLRGEYTITHTGWLQ
jgi:hypothetical protein